MWRCLLYSYLYVEYIRYAIHFSSQDVRVDSNSDICVMDVGRQVRVGARISGNLLQRNS